MPYAVLRKLGPAIVDACLSHPGAEWMPAADPGAGEEVSSSRSIVDIGGWELGGSVMPSHLEAAKSLEPLNGQLNQLAYRFGQHDGIIRSATSFETEGYWRFDPSTQSLCNSISSQRVTFQGKAASSGNAASIPGVLRIWRFQYEDDDVRYPIVVEKRLLPMERCGVTGSSIMTSRCCSGSKSGAAARYRLSVSGIALMSASSTLFYPGLKLMARDRNRYGSSAWPDGLMVTGQVKFGDEASGVMIMGSQTAPRPCPPF